MDRLAILRRPRPGRDAARELLRDRVPLPAAHHRERRPDRRRGVSARRSRRRRERRPGRRRGARRDRGRGSDAVHRGCDEHGPRRRRVRLDGAAVGQGRLRRHAPRPPRAPGPGGDTPPRRAVDDPSRRGDRRGGRALVDGSGRRSPEPASWSTRARRWRARRPRHGAPIAWTACRSRRSGASSWRPRATAWRPRRAPRPWAGAVVKEGETTTIDVTLHPGATVQGVVREVGSGKALAGVEVFALRRTADPRESPVPNTRTDAAGRYVLAGHPAGSAHPAGEEPHPPPPAAGRAATHLLRDDAPGSAHRTRPAAGAPPARLEGRHHPHEGPGPHPGTHAHGARREPGRRGDRGRRGAHGPGSPVAGRVSLGRLVAGVGPPLGHDRRGRSLRGHRSPAERCAPAPCDEEALRVEPARDGAPRSATNRSRRS